MTATPCSTGWSYRTPVGAFDDATDGMLADPRRATGGQDTTMGDPTMTTTHEDAAALAPAERASLTSGASFYDTKSAAGRVPVRFSDGPNGVRAQREGGGQDHLGLNGSEPATSFPPAAGLAQSWDEELVARVGAALGRESRSFDVDVLLGPAVNIRRDPRCGRNFEYFSEDPLLAGALGAAYVAGLQSEGVGASVKHFAANNQETDRSRVSADVDDRALREIYLKVFERIVKDADPWTVMASYNAINGVAVAENRWLLTDLLRGEWGFRGTVISDWSAVVDSAASVAAGLDLAMPGAGERPDAAVVRALEEGTLDAAALDAAAANVLALLDRAAAERGRAAAFDAEESHALAREAAARSAVLLQNDGGLLPLAPGARLAVIGTFAAEPRFQGGGSGFVNARRVDIPLEHIRELATPELVTYAAGFGGEDAESLRDEAVQAAREADVAIVFLGLDLVEESEGYDRESIDLPRAQLELLRAVAAVRPETVVVLSHGGVVLLGEVAEAARAIVDGALMGQGVGSGIADVLFGRVNPSGRLTETVPLRLEDAPSFFNFPGEHSHVEYGEGVFVGYRGYDVRGTEVAFPFGHGLSYTEFAYEGLAVRSTPAGIEVSLSVTNVGERDGREVVQVYVGKPASRLRRAPRELKGFRSVEIPAGETVAISLLLRHDDLAYWDVRQDDWIVEGGSYEISAGASSRDIRLSTRVELEGDELRVPLSSSSTLGELLAHPIAREVLAPVFAGGQDLVERSNEVMGSDVLRMVQWMPVDHINEAGAGSLDRGRIEALIAHVNEQSRERVPHVEALRIVGGAGED